MTLLCQGFVSAAASAWKASMLPVTVRKRQRGKDLVHQGCVSLSVDQCSGEGWGTTAFSTRN